MASDDIDRLVDVIAARVRERLATAAAPAPVPLRDQPCEEDPSSCSGCGHCVVRRPWAARVVAAEGAARIAAGPDTGPVEGGLARLIDHTLLKPDASSQEVERLCAEARKHGFASV